MIDTIVLRSTSISDEVANKIERLCIERTGIDFENDEVLYRFTSKELKGSYDASIRVSVNREKWVSSFDSRLNKDVTSKVSCSPFLEIECSLHKFFLGHNILGGSDGLLLQVAHLIAFIEAQFDVSLPSFLEYTISRIDIARVYDLGDNISNFFRGFSNVYYPRRQVQKYGDTGLYFPGSHTTLKLYDKGVEFNKHDKKRLRHFLDIGNLKALEDLAFGKLRIELEIKSRKLRHLYNDLPTVKTIVISDLYEQFNDELRRVFKMAEKNTKLYNKSNDVERILFQTYGPNGYNLLGTWYRLTVNGYEQVKSSMPKTTFYRHINKLKDAGITWNHTDIVKTNQVVDFVFNPFDTDLEVTDDYIIDLIA